MKKRCKCATDIADVICDLLKETSTKECAYSGVAEIKLVEYDGSKFSFEICLGNAFAEEKLRDYGLKHIIPFILKNLPDLYACKAFDEVSQFLLLHDNNLLLRIINKNASSDRVLHLQVCDVLKALEEQEAIEKRYPKLKVLNNYLSRYSLGPVSPLVRNLVVASVVGATVGIVTYLFMH